MHAVQVMSAHNNDSYNHSEICGIRMSQKQCMEPGMHRQGHRGRRKDFWSGPAVIGAREARTQFFYMNFIKLPKKVVRPKPDQPD